jgi:hypothetical protein
MTREPVIANDVSASALVHFEMDQHVQQLPMSFEKALEIYCSAVMTIWCQ